MTDDQRVHVSFTCLLHPSLVLMAGHVGRTSLTLVLLLLLLPAGYARALALKVDQEINFYPPNPCNETFVGGNSLEGYTLNGEINLFLGEATRTGAIASTGVADLACGASLRLPAVQILNLNVTERTPLLLQFGGNLIPDSGPPEIPFYAFDHGTAEGDDAVSAPPSILLGYLDMGSSGLWIPNPGPPDFPLFAFASPGTQIGTLTVNVTAVTAPGTLLLMMAGLAGMAALRGGGLDKSGKGSEHSFMSS